MEKQLHLKSEEEDTAADDCSDTKDSLEVRHSDISAIDHPGTSEVGNTSSTTKQAPPVEVVTFQDPTKRPRQARKPPVPEVKDKVLCLTASVNGILRFHLNLSLLSESLHLIHFSSLPASSNKREKEGGPR